MGEILAMSRSSLRRLLLRPRFLVSLMLALGCVWTAYSQMPPYLAQRGFRLQAVEPFLLLVPSIWPQMLLLISFLLLVGDVPFLYPGLETTALRSSKRKWLAAQLLAALGAALLWLLLVFVFTLPVFAGRLSFQNEWSLFLKGALRTGGLMESYGMFLIDKTGTELLANSTPYVRFAETLLLQLLLFWSVTLWSLTFNLWTRRSYGCMITVSFWVLRRVVKGLAMTTQKDYSFLSPMSLVDLNQKTLTQERIIYIALFFLLQIVVLWILSALRVKREDLSKAG